jgi:hypothetical protein
MSIELLEETAEAIPYPRLRNRSNLTEGDPRSDRACIRPAGRQDSAWLRRIVFESDDAVPDVRVDGSVSLMKTKEGSSAFRGRMCPSRCVQDSSVSRVDASAPALRSHERSGELLHSVAVT